MIDPPYGRARKLLRQKSMPDTAPHSLPSSSSTNPPPLAPLPPIPTAPATPMIQLPDGHRISLADLMDLVATQRFSSPPHFYREPTMGPQPIFRNGRDRFPIRELRWHSTVTNNPNRYEVPPGKFADEVYMGRWNGPPLHIRDSSIRNIYPERMFGGIHYCIDINPAAWNNQPLLRGDIIVFRGFESDNIKYVVTWKRNTHFDDDTSYVQVNAMGKYQETVETSDADWPTIGFFVPTRLCEISTPPPPRIHYDPFGQNPFTNPFSAQEIPFPLPDQSPPSPVERRNGEVLESNGIFHKITRKASHMINRSKD